MVDTPCPLCGTREADPWWTTPDRAFGVPGLFTVARCRACRFLYQRPRVRDDCLAACYPAHYPRHQEPSPRIPFKGSPARIRAVRYALASALGYRALEDGVPGVLTRLHARLLARKLWWSCPPWIGDGRYLDVGCGSGASLGVARALGWRGSGIETDVEAAARARAFTDDLYVGDVLDAPFEAGRFDVVTAFHVLEHLPDPVAAVERMLGWLAPGGLLIVEVPNAGGLGARLFGAAWSGLELPRHLSHFTPVTLSRLIDRAGGRVVRCRHQAKPRHYLWSMQIAFRARGWARLARVVESPPVRGISKTLLELILPIVSWSGGGEVIRAGVIRDARRSAQ